MDINSSEELERVIKELVHQSFPMVANEMIDVMLDEIKNQIYDDHEPKYYQPRTGQLQDSPQIVDISYDTIEVEYQDNGGWSSVITGEPFFPLEGFEVGSVWAPHGKFYKTNLMEEALRRCEEVATKKIKEYLRSQGIDVL